MLLDRYDTQSQQETLGRVVGGVIKTKRVVFLFLEQFEKIKIKNWEYIIS